MALSEADARAKLIDPAIDACGWFKDTICRETTLGTVEIVVGQARRPSRGRTDYTLRVSVCDGSQPVAFALIEATKESLPPNQRARAGKATSRHNVLFVFASNGYRSVEFDWTTRLTTSPSLLSEFPTRLNWA